MKKLLLLILFVSLFSYCYGSNNIKALKDEGIMILDSQSFLVAFENWGKVRFLSCEYDEDGINKLLFYLANEKDDILYAFPDFYGNDWCFYEVKAIAFKDINKDGLKDVIVIADYLTGIGNEGAIPFPVCGIYFQKGNKFIDIPEINEEINDAKQNIDIERVMKFIDKRDKEVKKFLEKK